MECSVTDLVCYAHFIGGLSKPQAVCPHTGRRSCIRRQGYRFHCSAQAGELYKT